MAVNPAYIRVRTTTLLFCAFLTPALFGQTQDACNLVTQSEADALLGGSSKQVPVGKLGCAYSLRSAGLSLSISSVLFCGMSAMPSDASWFTSCPPMS